MAASPAGGPLLLSFPSPFRGPCLSPFPVLASRPAQESGFCVLGLLHHAQDVRNYCRGQHCRRRKALFETRHQGSHGRETSHPASMGKEFLIPPCLFLVWPNPELPFSSSLIGQKKVLAQLLAQLLRTKARVCASLAEFVLCLRPWSNKHHIHNDGKRYNNNYIPATQTPCCGLIRIRTATSTVRLGRRNSILRM